MKTILITGANDHIEKALGITGKAVSMRPTEDRDRPLLLVIATQAIGEMGLLGAAGHKEHIEVVGHQGEEIALAVEGLVGHITAELLAPHLHHLGHDGRILFEDQL